MKHCVIHCDHSSANTQCLTATVLVLRTEVIHEAICDAFHGITDEFDHLEKQDAAVYIRAKQLRVMILLFCVTIHHPFAYLRRY